MSFSRRHHFRRRNRDRGQAREHQSEFFNDQSTGMHDRIHPEHTGAESDYLKSLVDSRAKVTVVLKTGERLHGRVRYYDRHCFSLGLSARGPRLFLRKESISYISEEPQAASSPKPPIADPETEFEQ